MGLAMHKKRVIGVDACCWSNRRGFGRFTRELLTALLAVDNVNEYLLFADGATCRDATFPPNAKVVRVDTEVSPTEAASGTGRRSLRDVWAFTHAAWNYRMDVFFFPAVYSYFPLLNRTRLFLTVHDIIADKHSALTFPNWKLKLFWKLKQNAAIRQADTVLTVSEYSKQEIARFYRLAPSKLRTITEAPSPVFREITNDEETTQVLARYGLSKQSRFLLHVGGFSPHKNLSTLVTAFHRLRSYPEFADVTLMLVGDYEGDSFHSGFAALKAQIDALALQRAIVLTGYVPDAELAHIYHAACAFVFPSLEEGFGLPLVEAMACGTPVIASNRGSLPEIGGDAAIYFDPIEADGLTELLRGTLSNDSMRKQMSVRGLEQARTFTWETAARQLLGHFEEAMMR